MFDIGFQELVLIAGVALVVIGPEKLPEFTRKAAQWANEVRRSVQAAGIGIEAEHLERHSMTALIEESAIGKDGAGETDSMSEGKDGKGATKSSSGSREVEGPGRGQGPDYC